MGWFKDAKEISSLAETVKSSNGIFFLPTLTGLRHPINITNGKAAIIGLSMAHTKAHLARAILEGIAQSVAVCAEASSEVADMPISEIMAGGGLSGSDALLQSQADQSGMTLLRMPDHDRATLRGAAFLGGCDGLLWNNLAEACSTLPQPKVFTPKTTASERADWKEKWNSLVNEEVVRSTSTLYH